MRICMMSSEFPPVVAGVSNYVYKLSTELAARGHKVTVITRGSRRKWMCDQNGGIFVFRLPSLNIYPIHISVHGMFQNRLLRVLENEFDVVHIHHPLTPPCQTSLPVLVTAHSSIGESITSPSFYSAGPRLPYAVMYLMRMYFGHLERGTVKKADLVTAVSKAVADELMIRYGRELPESVKVLGNGVDTRVFTPGTAARSPSLVLYVGRLAWSKGLEDLVKTAHLILQERRDVSFAVAGDGPAKLYLKGLIGDMGLVESFSMLGNLAQPELIELYRRATILVLPTRSEGMPTSLLEAMACGLPAVASNVGGIPEILQNNLNGVIVPPGDPKAIADSVMGLLQDEATRVKMGTAARRTVKERYDWSGLVNRLERYYEDVMRGKTSSGNVRP